MSYATIVIIATLTEHTLARTHPHPSRCLASVLFPFSGSTADKKMCLCVALALGGGSGACLHWRRVFIPLLACAPCGLMVFCLGGAGEKKNCSSRFLFPPFAPAILRPLRFICPCDGGGGGSFNRDICLAETSEGSHSTIGRHRLGSDSREPPL